MPERNDESTGTEIGYSDDDVGRICRRRLLQVAGAGVVGSTFLSGSALAADPCPHQIIFDGSAASGDTSYEFGASGPVVAGQDDGPLEDGDTIDGSSVSGVVSADRDAYWFGGNITHLAVGGAVNVSVVYADTSESGPDRIQIFAAEGTTVDYVISCDGRVEKVLDNGDHSAEEGNDTVSEHDDGTWSVEGFVEDGWGDTYDVYGEITHIEPVTDDYSLYLNGDAITLEELTGQQPSDGDEEGAEPADPNEHRLVITTPSEGSVDYEMGTSGQITKVLDNGDNKAEQDNDAVTQHDDGTWSITGMTGNGYGDTLLFVGEALSFDADGDFSLYLDGEEITPAELVGEEQNDGDGTLDEAVVRVGFDYSDWLTYSLHVDARPEPLSAGEDEYFEATNYETEQLSDGSWLIEGQTGTADPSGPMYGDGYRLTPADGNGILGWAASAPDDQEYVVSINGTEIDPATLPALDLPEETEDDSGGDETGNGVVGGGPGYGDAVTVDDADYVVSTANELSGALSSAAAGEVVFVRGSADIDLGGSSFGVPAGVTLASNRGVDGSAGALLSTGQEPTELFRLHGDARLTGLRITGPNPGGTGGSSSSARAVTVSGTGVEIDNCDVHGFSYAGIFVNGGDGHIHHNVIRECNKGGLGYGISMVSGNPTIEYNYFNYNRHSVATDGSHHGYVCRYNHFGPDLTSHVVDMHDPAGTRYEVHNNVVEGYVDTGGGRRPAVAVRGVPDDEAVIRDNWFWNPAQPLSSPSYTWTDEAIIQPETGDSWSNVSFSDNAYGEGASRSFADVIPGYDGWRSD